MSGWCYNKSGLMRIHWSILIGLVVGALLTGGYWYFKIHPRLKSISGEFEQPQPTPMQTLQVQEDPAADFDLTLNLPGSPIGIASNKSELILCNRTDPWGFLRLRSQDPQNYQAQKVTVIEPYYGQKMGFQTVTWNGKSYVSYTYASYLQLGKGMVFSIHHPVTLTVISHHKAPEFIGGLAWDGTGYWAATRRDTADSGDPAYLYRLDGDFNVISKNEPPDVGCQGLAWDGNNLWFVDVFSDKIYVLDVYGEKPEVVYSYHTSFNYLSGIGFDGENIWISEYDYRRLHRLKPSLFALWTAEQIEPEPSTTQITEEPAPTKATYTNTFADTGNEAMDVLELSAEIRGSSLYASWKIHFGENLFKENTPAEESTISMPTFARYTISVEGGSLSERKELQYDAEPGDNFHKNEELIQDLGPGTYSISVFLHAQYVNEEGTNRILNSSSPSIEVTNQ